ncbi:hypothetical protein ABW20_dc0103144 [Dactylellina cionopaga]|nr:hypothetical protein ABW20_dc0103144 [Dactylellina cionopaga]
MALPPAQGEYRVHSFHLNINEGDSAVHLLVDGTDEDENQWKILKAVLIDGGRPKFAYVIRDFRYYVNNQLNTKYIGGFQSFDAIVITHWDGDHYQGVLSLLESDIQTQIDNYVFNNPNNITDETTFQTLLNNYTIRSSFIKYGLNGPLTNIYLPYFTIAGFADTDSAGNNVVIPPAHTNDLVGQAPSSQWTLSTKIINGRAMVMQSAYVRVPDAGGGNPKKKRKVTWEAKMPIGILRTGQDLVGRDLFTDQLVMDPTLALSPKTVSDALEHADQDRPIMFCMAADTFFCDEAGRAARKALQWYAGKAKNRELILRPAPSTLSTEADNEQNPLMDLMNKSASKDISAKFVSGHTTGNNSSSISCIIVWRSYGEGPQVTHYFSGDVGDDVEEELLRWLSVPRSGSNIRDPINLQIYKLSHHGAKFSTPIQTLFALDPLWVIGPNGLHKGHNHVSWDTLLLIFIWTYWSKRFNKPTPRLYCTNFPIYLVAWVIYNEGQKGTGYVKPGSLESFTGSNGKDFRDIVLDPMWADAQGDKPDTWIKLNAEFTICEFLRTRWEAFCGINSDIYYDWGVIQDGMMKASGQGIRGIFAGQSPGGRVFVDGIIGSGYDTWTTMDDLLTWSAEPDDALSVPLGLHISDAFQEDQVYIFAKPVNNRTAATIGSANFLKQRNGPFTNSSVGNFLAMQDVGDVDASSFESALANQKPDDQFDIHSLSKITDHNLPTITAGVDEDLVYFVASDAEIRQNIAHKISTKTGSNLDLILGKLKTGAIVFPNEVTVDPSWTDFDASDELYQWLLTILGISSDASTYRLNGKVSTSQITGFSYTTRLAAAFTDRNHVSAKIPACQVSITFSTESNSYGLKGTKLPDWLLPPAERAEKTNTDVIGPGQMLLMNLGPSAANDTKGKTFTLTDIIVLLDIKVSNTFKTILGFTGKVTFALDIQPGSKNALWFFPDVHYTTTMRLLFAPSDKTEDLIQTVLDTLHDMTGAKPGTIEINNIRIVGKKVWKRKGTMTSDFTNEIESGATILLTVILNSTVGGKPKSLRFDAAIALEKKATMFVVTLDPNNSGMPISDLLDFLASMLPIDVDLSPSKFLPGSVLDAVKLRRFTFVRSEKGTSKRFSTDFQIDWSEMTLQCKLQVDLVGKNVEPAFFGGLFPKNRPEQMDEDFSFVSFTPGYESWVALPVVPQARDGLLRIMDVGSDTGNLNSLFKTLTKGLGDLPTPPINLDLIGLSFSATKHNLKFGAMVTSPAPKPSSKVPPVRLGACVLDLRYNLDQKELDELSFATSIVLSSPKGDRTAQIALLLDLEDDGWLVQGGITGLSGDLLYSLFDADCNTEIANFLRNIKLTINMAYFYGTGGQGSNFKINGTLTIGKFDLDYNYIHNGTTLTDPDLPKWSFDAKLSVTSNGCTLKDIVSSLMGNDLADSLPDFIGDIDILPSGKTELTSLRIVKRQKYLVLALRLHLADGASVQYYQIQANRTSPTDKTTFPVKRIVLFALDKLPMDKLSNIPLVGKMAQPFDVIEFSWVNSTMNADGFTRAELDDLGQALGTSELKPGFKDNVKPAKRTPQDVLATNGFHFVVRNQQEIIIDYVFGNKKKEEKKTGMEVALAETSSDNGNYISPMDKKIGPVALTGLGVKFDMKTSTLTIGLNGSVTLGPIELVLMGFSISFSFPKGVTLKTLGRVKASFGLDGLGASLQKPPLTIAGLFLHQKTETLDEYLGAAALGFQPYLFQAAGYYGEETIKTVYRTKDRTVTSFFTYCRLDGPIATIGVADISGLTAGFGFNTFCTFPNASNVVNFPLIGVPSSNNIVDAMSKLLNGNPAWFGRRENSYWFAAGLSGSALETLTLSAVVALEFNPLPKIGIFGVATAEMPKSSPMKLAKVQLGIVATIDFGAGVLSIEGQLTPASFVLDPNCHLTGGFGLFYWFNPRDSNLRGQFVFTVGGYHKAFQRPSQFPNPPRLGFNWKFDSAISIVGECYFAITPKAVMGGGRLHVTLDLGPLQAYFDAWADFLINYKPFHFMAEGGISVGVHFELDLWFVTISIDIDISATLFLQGPPVNGTVHVDFWVFGFDVDFGDRSANSFSRLTLLEFYRTAIQQDTKKPQAVLQGGQQEKIMADDEPSPHTFSCTSGLIPDSNAGDDTSGKPKPWTVRGAIFAFNVSCKFPVRTGKVITAMSGADDQEHEFKTKSKDDIFAKPMGLVSPLETSNLSIRIELLKPQAQDIDTKDAKLPKWDKVETVTSQLPSALWAKYDTSEDPTGGRNNQSSLLNSGPDGARDLTTDIILYAPKSAKSEDKIPRFDIIKASELLAATANFPQPEDESKNWKPLLPLASTPYDDVKQKWTIPDLGADAAMKAADMWAAMSIFGWDSGDKWNGAPPLGLVTRLDETYTEKLSMTQEAGVAF